jgi:hypothetical protein
MLVVDKKGFLIGTAMALTFLIVLFLMFSPLFGKLNAFESSDGLFNSIAKGSSNYFEDLREQSAGHRGSTFASEIKLKNEDAALKAGALLSKAGVMAEVRGSQIHVTGDLGQLAQSILEDSEALFHDRGTEIARKHGYPEKEVLFLWWNILKETQKGLEAQGSFKAAAFIHDVTMRGVEVAYNFYGIEAKNASTNAGILTGALVFYIVYTLWWGYAILHLFNGFGMEMKASVKKEV